jgi:hypothetical protein
VSPAGYKGFDRIQGWWNARRGFAKCGEMKIRNVSGSRSPLGVSPTYSHIKRCFSLSNLMAEACNGALALQQSGSAKFFDFQGFAYHSLFASKTAEDCHCHNGFPLWI